MRTTLAWLIVLMGAVGAALADPPVEQGKWIGRMPLADNQPAKAPLSALERYVKFDDGAFAWEHAGEQKVDGATVHALRVTSQRWRPDGQTDHPLWKHWVAVAVPETVRSKMAILIIGGGSHRDRAPDRVPADMLLLVRAAGAVVIYVDNVPNQPLKLEGEEQGRTEDGLVARSWVLAMRDDDASWIVRFPMVKSAVKAMDAAQAFLKSREGLPQPDGFFVVGASKRGWTTWLTAAVDQRVKGIAPMVIDVLNIAEHTPHHWRSYGFWAPSLKDYEANDIPSKFGTPELAQVIAHEDPLAYLSRVKGTPKYLVNATGDEFFPTDSLRHYEKQIPGVWRARCVPNAGHSLRNSMAPFEILSFYRAVAKGMTLPEMTWSTVPSANGDQLTVRTNVKPLSVSLWEVTAKARDFRISETGAAWTQTMLSAPEGEENVYRLTVTKPATGWKAYLVECRFPGADGDAEPLVFTTRVFITPDTLPFELPTPVK